MCLLLVFTLPCGKSDMGYPHGGSRYTPFVVFSCASTVHERANQVKVSQCNYANWLFLLFSRHISLTQSFQENRHYIFHVGILLKPFVLLISRLVAFSIDKHTNKQID
jgi:hypothetical protein